MTAKDGKPCKSCGGKEWYKSGHCKRCTRDNTRARHKLNLSREDSATIDKGLEVRFWEKVKKGPTCWEWTASKDRKGYGRITSTLGTRNLKAHRVSYELHNGPITPGLWVLHVCDNPGCVRPDHLFLGTNADNVRDMLNKGRSRKGETNGAASRLTTLDVRYILEARRHGESLRSIAARFHVSCSTVYAITSGRTWSHVTKE